MNRQRNEPNSHAAEAPADPIGGIRAKKSLPRLRPCAAVAFLAALSIAVASAAAAEDHPHGQRSITDTTLEWPSWVEFVRVLSLRDYNTRVVVLGTVLLGTAAGVVGTFAYLRKRALMGDALSHATLPGIAAVFLWLGSKDLPILIAGAAASGVLGVLAVIALRQVPRIRADAAIGIVLSVFFGAGMVLFSFVQQMRTGNEAGLQTFIYGKAAAMLQGDAVLIGACGLMVISVAAALFKEFRLVCFDQAFASASGFHVVFIDLIMMALVVLTTVVGLQAVGLILIVALLIIPAASARFWTDGLLVMTLLAALIGAVSGWLGSTFSALLPRLPTGAVIVMCAGLIFFVSMLLAPRRGVVASLMRRWMLQRKIGYQHLLRALVEREEMEGEDAAIELRRLLRARSWSPKILRRIIRRAVREGAVVRVGQDGLRLTTGGRVEATRILRNHRLWEMYLIRYADIAPSHVDRDADEVEHVLSEAIVRELERAMDAVVNVPPSPHLYEAR